MRRSSWAGAPWNCHNNTIFLDVEPNDRISMWVVPWSLPAGTPAPERRSRNRADQLRRGGEAATQRAFAAGVVVLILLLSAASARAQAPDSETSRQLPDEAYDVLLMRPMGLASLAVGTGFFLIAAPFTAPFGDVGAIWELFVEDPFEFTFRRALGDLEG